MKPVQRRHASGCALTMRDYDSERDSKALTRILRDIHWASSETKAKDVDFWYRAGRTLAADLDGVLSCLSASVPGSIRHQESVLPLSAVTAVVTSPTARRQGLALELTARLLAEDVADGAQVAMLGVFEQGFYDRLGFGSGPGEVQVSCDLADLRVPARARPALRFGMRDVRDLHAAMANRQQGHGSCVLHPPEFTEGVLKVDAPQFQALGYRDGDSGEITHFFLANLSKVNGPMKVYMMAWRNHEQLLELLALLASLGDQVWCASLQQPRGVQLQDLLSKPLKRPDTTEKGEYEMEITAYSFWQLRLLDLPGCLQHTHLQGDSTLEFNLELNDPVAAYLDRDASWRGIGGSWTVGLGGESYARPGHRQRLPLLRASAGAFSRLWAGVAPATALALTDDMQGPPELLCALDERIRLPQFLREWDF